MRMETENRKIVTLESIQTPYRACSVIFNPYGLEGIDTDWRGF
jgi:hypothetical protein